MNMTYISSSLEPNSTKWPKISTNDINFPRERLQLTKGALIFMSFLMILMILISISGNSVVCYIVYRKPTMRSGINLLLASLALSDLLLSLISMPMATVLLHKQTLFVSVHTCKLGAVLFYTFQTEKILLLVAISVDRYYIIVRRKDNLNTYRAKVIIGVTWMFSFLLTLPPIFGFGQYIYIRPQCTLNGRLSSVLDMAYICLFECLSGFVPCLVMLISYGLILRTVRRNCFRVQNHPPVNPTAMHRKGKLFIDYSYKTRTFTTIAVLSLVYIVCVVPLKIVEICTAFGYGNPTSSAIVGVLWLSYSHTALNPIIYTIRIKKFREACVDAIPKPFLMIPKLVPHKTRRRIRPYAVYEVDRNLSIVTTVI